MSLKRNSGLLLLGGVGCWMAAPSVAAQGLLTEKTIALALAQEVAGAALLHCRRQGYAVTVTVVDRAGRVKAVLRDDGAGPHTLDSSRRKAYSALSWRTSTTAMAQVAADNPGAAHLHDIDGVLLVGGGLPLRVGDEVVGAIGVGGAPGGDKDEACAQAGFDTLIERLK